MKDSMFSLTFRQGTSSHLAPAPPQPPSVPTPSLYQPLPNGALALLTTHKPPGHFSHLHRPASFTHHHLSLRSVHLLSAQCTDRTHSLPFGQSGLREVKIESCPLPVYIPSVGTLRSQQSPPPGHADTPSQALATLVLFLSVLSPGPGASV